MGTVVLDPPPAAQLPATASMAWPAFHPWIHVVRCAWQVGSVAFVGCLTLARWRARGWEPSLDIHRSTQDLR
jgi:hypothetical protein